MQDDIPMPPIASEEEWRQARLALLEKEKALTKQYDRVSAERRRLPMVKVDRAYTFMGPEGERSLLDLFQGQRQLIVYHFMFDPTWDKGCPGCTGFVNALGDLSMLGERDTRFVLISRAPLEKLERYRAEMGWEFPWYSSHGSEFNYDYQVSADDQHGPITYNYKTAADFGRTEKEMEGEGHGVSVFFRNGSDVFHTYSTYARGAEDLTDSYRLLDLTPYGRQEDFEDSPAGWPQKPTYG